MSAGAAHDMAAAGPAAPDSNAVPACFEHNLGWLLGQCHRAYSDAVERAVADLPHGHRGFQALFGAVNGTAHNQAELAKHLGVDRTVMVYLVDDLEKAGLAQRLPDPNDRRSRLIRATEAGRARLAEAQGAISAAEAELLAALSADERESFRGALCRIAARRPPGRSAEACEAPAAAERRSA